MSLHVRQAGLWKPVPKLHVGQAGLLLPARRGFVRDAGVWKQFFQHEAVIEITGTMGAVLVKDLFDAVDASLWGNALINKRVIVAPGASVNANQSWGGIAIQDGGLTQATSFAGSLTIDNYGVVSGIGGAANSGVGGNAFLANFKGRSGQKAILNNYGTLRSGGGGGGRGGNGGQGYYQTPYTVYEPAGGGWLATDYNNYLWSYTGATTIRWAGVLIANNTGGGFISTYTSGGYTYHRGPGPQGETAWYNLRRTSTAYNTYYTSGGTGGNGGRGQGSDGANAAGSAGTAGGTNAGAGATGATGGGWGLAGGTGPTGPSGNYSAGTAGLAGGLAGCYLNGNSNIILNNFGTLLGRIS